MNSPQDPRGPRPAGHPKSEADKASLQVTNTLFRVFILVLLGAFFIYQLDLTYLWLTAILTIIAAVLGITVLVRAVRRKASRLLLAGTISGLTVTTLMILMILGTALFFHQFRDYQQCTRSALTETAKAQCQSQLQDSLPEPPR